jgi:hypothetical protein
VDPQEDAQARHWETVTITTVKISERALHRDPIFFQAVQELLRVVDSVVPQQDTTNTAGETADVDLHSCLPRSQVVVTIVPSHH